MNLRFRRGRGALQEVEVAALVGLADMGRKRRAVAALETGRRLLPGSAPAVELLLADVKMDAARRHVDLDLVAGLDEGERTADVALRGNVKDTGAVARAAHAPVGDAHHVAHAR